MGEFLSHNPIENELGSQHPNTSNELNKESETIHYYNQIDDYIRAYEKSPEFEAELQWRLERLQEKNPYLDADDIRDKMRDTDEYHRGLREFYEHGNRFPINDNAPVQLPEEVRSTIQDYWEYAQFYYRRLGVLRAMYGDDRDRLREETEKLEKNRVRIHTRAAKALIGGGLPPIPDEDSRKIPEYRDVNIGRQLVFLITEDKLKDEEGWPFN